MAEKVTVKGGGSLDGAQFDNAASEATLKALLDAVNKMSSGNATSGKNAGDQVNKYFNQALKGNAKALDETTNKHDVFQGILGKTGNKAKELGDSMASAATSIIGAGFGMVMGGLVAAGKGLIGMFTESLDAFRETSSVGASFNNDLVLLRKTAAEAAMPLDMFTDSIKKNSQVFSQLGGTVTGGAQAFAKMSNQLRTGAFGTQMMGMGMTMGDLNDYMTDYLDIQMRMGRLQGRSEQELIAGTQEYILEMDKLSKATGLSRKQVEDGLKKAMVDGRMQFLASKLQGRALNDFQSGVSLINNKFPEFTDTLSDAMIGVVNPGDKFANMLNSVVPSFRGFNQALAKGMDMEDQIAGYKKQQEELTAFMGTLNQEQLKDPAIQKLQQYLGKLNEVIGSNTKEARDQQAKQNQITTAMTTFGQKIEEIKSKIIIALIDSKIFDKVQAGLTNIAEWFNKNVNKIAPFFDNLIKGIDDNLAAGDLSGAISSAFEKIFDALKPIAIGAIRALFDSPETKKKRAELEAKRAEITKNVENGNISERVGDRELAEVESKIAELDKANDPIDKLKENLKSVIPGFETLEKIIHGVEWAFKNWGTVLLGAGGVVVGLSALSKLITSVFSSALGGISKGVGDAASSISKGVSETSSSLSKGLGDAISNISKGFGDLIANLSSSIGTGISSLSKGFGDLIANLSKGIGEGISSLSKSIGDTMSSLSKGLSDTIANISKSIGSGISSLSKGLGDLIANLSSGIGAGISSLSKGLGDAISSLSKGIGDLIANISKGIGSSISSLSKGIGDLIANLSSGIGAGISSLSKGIGDLIANLSSGIGAGISSLSKGLGDLIANLSSGIGAGISSLSKGIGDAIANISKGIGSGLSSILSGMASGLSAFANPAALIGLGALTLAFIGLGTALNLAAPGIEALNPILIKVADVVGNTVVKAFETLETIAKTFLEGFKAIPEIFEKLANIGATNLISTSVGIAAVGASLAVFAAGGALASLVSGTGLVDLSNGLKALGEVNGEMLAKLAPSLKAISEPLAVLGGSSVLALIGGNGLGQLATGLKAFEEIDPTKIANVGPALEGLHKALSLFTGGNEGLFASIGTAIGNFVKGDSGIGKLAESFKSFNTVDGANLNNVATGMTTLRTGIGNDLAKQADGVKVFADSIKNLSDKMKELQTSLEQLNKTPGGSGVINASVSPAPSANAGGNTGGDATSASSDKLDKLNILMTELVSINKEIRGFEKDQVDAIKGRNNAMGGK
jgi:hypothetical protein